MLFDKIEKLVAMISPDWRSVEVGEYNKTPVYLNSPLSEINKIFYLSSKKDENDVGGIRFILDEHDNYILWDSNDLIHEDILKDEYTHSLLRGNIVLGAMTKNKNGVVSTELLTSPDDMGLVFGEIPEDSYDSLENHYIGKFMNSSLAKNAKLLEEHVNFYE